MLEHEGPNSADLGPTESAAILKANRVEPELGAVLVSFDMNVHRLVTISGVEEEAVRPTPKNRWHPGKLYTVESGNG